MRILIVSHSFPPYNSVGTVRVSKMAKYLARQGHELRVLTAAPQSYPEGLKLEIPEEWVTATRWVNLRAPALRLSGGEPGSGAPNDARRGLLGRVAAMVWGVYRQVIGYPDLMAGWIPYAVLSGRRLIEHWRPDVIFATAPPYTALVIASMLSRRTGIPWVAELRDLWVNTHLYPYSRLRKHFERRTEKAVLSSAAALVTVSEPLAATLRASYSAPVEVVMNGFDREDFPPRLAAPSGGSFRLVYTGNAHPLYQSPKTLLSAIASSPRLQQGILVELYGPRLEFVSRLARELGVEENVRVNGPVPFEEALSLQRSADALLLLLWSDPQQTGVLTGKLFEYLGARRPILAVGSTDEEAGRLVRRRSAGTVVLSVEEARAQLEAWLSDQEQGHLADIPAAAGSGLSREDQALRLAEFLARVLPGKMSPAWK